MSKDENAAALGRKRWKGTSKAERVAHMTELSRKAAEVRSMIARLKRATAENPPQESS